MSSGAVKIGAGDVRIEPIEGPGVCGMDYPLKVSMLGEPPSLAFADDMRPPAAVPQDRACRAGRCASNIIRRTVQSAPVARVAPHEQLRWVTGPPPANAPQGEPAAAAAHRCRSRRKTSQDYSYVPAPAPPPRAAPRPWISPDTARAMPEPDDIPPDAILPGGRRPTPQATAHATRLQRARLSAAGAAHPARARPHAWALQPGVHSASRAEAGRQARLSDRLRARPLGERRRAAGGAALVPVAGDGDPPDRQLFLPRHGGRGHAVIFPSTPSATRSTFPASRSPTAAPSR